MAWASAAQWLKHCGQLATASVALVEVLNNFWPLVERVLQLDTTAIARFSGQAGSGQLALLVVLVAGVSEAVGNSVVLFINRVRPTRFLLTLLVSSVILAFTYLFWTLTVFAVARLAFGVQSDYALIAEVVAFGFAPRIFGFIEFLPVLGRPFGVILQIWSLLAVLLGVATVLALEPWQALLTVALGALVLLTLQQTVGRPLLALAHWLQARASGVNLVLDRKGLTRIVNAGQRRSSK